MEKTCTFDFAAPQFLESLSKADLLADQDGADSFFDSLTSTPFKSKYTTQDKGTSETFYTPDGQRKNEVKNFKSGRTHNEIAKVDTHQILKERHVRKAKRRSLLVLDPKHPMSREDKCIFDGIEVPTGKEKDHTMVTRQDKIHMTPTLELRTKQVVREAQKRKGVTKLDEAWLKKKQASQFMSLAEKIMHFQVDTPPRYKSKLISFEEKENKNISLKPTVPESPNLITKFRIRPVEKVESEEQQKNFFKAGKLNLKIFEKPENRDRPKPKTPTVPKPFNLTEISKKDYPKDEIFQFKARPLPKWISSSCDSLNTSTTSSGSDHSRNRHRRRKPLKTLQRELEETEDEDTYGGIITLTNCNVSTQVKPFSFDERDKELLRKKEDKIKKIQEEERKVPIFHAAPTPSFITNSYNGTLRSAVSTCSLYSDTGSIKSGRISNLETNVGETNFKAKFPSVLYKEPFIPQKSERPTTSFINFELNTEKRAQDRQEFDKELKIKEEKLEEERKQIMAIIEEKEKTDLIALRKKLVHKAQPVPQCNNSNSVKK